MTSQSQRDLTADALSIWRAGVDAVKPASLFRQQVNVENSWLRLGDEEVDLSFFERLVVVGAGKASATMAIEFERQCLSKIDPAMPVVGWVNAPEGSFDRNYSGRIHLHAARPAGINLPTVQAVEGTNSILKLVRNCNARDLCIVLLSGGGSALLVAPVDGISLADKQQIATRVAAAGGNIEQLNAIRRALSAVKGGKLAQACGAGMMVTLIISDVLGDPLETIASGPTYPSKHDIYTLARSAIRDLGLEDSTELETVVSLLRRSIASPVTSVDDNRVPVKHIVLGNNATAVDACGTKAVELGYQYVMQSAQRSEGDVTRVASMCAEALWQLTQQQNVDCWISGGEPTVALPRDHCGQGGRNQQLALLTLLELVERHPVLSSNSDFVFLSGGTDGEDGPTDAAGAWIDQSTFDRARRLDLVPRDFASQADAYSFFSPLGELIRTGPTGTNVCDVRVGLTMPRLQTTR